MLYYDFIVLFCKMHKHVSARQSEENCVRKFSMQEVERQAAAKQFNVTAS